ncbi:CAP domain-containing protein [[Pseudomonas] boreopolis]|uniref:SCP domain-containing protein n=1 Tax=Xanthomonas boreopolis TaxID=86183 RepID=A0A919KJI0_9XANT|nr:hypothetical protein GCM10009090_26760 [[Pseudomonas] boreopolis]
MYRHVFVRLPLLSASFLISPLQAAVPAAIALPYQVRPDIPTCEPGRLSEATRQRVLDLVNQLRTLHGLAPVAYAPQLQAQADAAALVMAANGALSHMPAPDWRCASPLAQQGARTSLLYGGAVSPLPAMGSADDIVARWLSDTNNLVADGLGHRRWLLDPFLREVAFAWVAGPLANGMQSGAAALRLERGSNAEPLREGGEVVAWPVGDYPGRYFDPNAWLSFSLLVDPSRPGGANHEVDYRQARVQVRDPDGNVLPLLALRYDNEYYGLPNNLQFRVAGLRPGIRYDVVVDGVGVAGELREFRYGFRVVP